MRPTRGITDETRQILDERVSRLTPGGSEIASKIRIDGPKWHQLPKLWSLSQPPSHSG
jgi:hypothetical protein